MDQYYYIIYNYFITSVENYHLNIFNILNCIDI